MWKKIWKKNLHCLLLSARNSAPSQITTKPLQTRRPIPCQKTKFLINPRSNNTRRISTLLSNEYLNPGFIRTPQCNRRLYYTDQRGYEHFRRRGFGPHHVKDNTDKYRIYAFVAISVGGISALVYSANQEIIPYTYRKHFVLISPKFESQLVDMQFDALKQQWKSHILPPMHPDSVRVRRIARDVIQAVLEGTKTEQDVHGSNKERVIWKDPVNMPIAKAWQTQNDIPDSEKWGTRDEILQEQWVDESRTKGLKEKAKPYVEHLKPAKWEVLVVEDNNVNAFCLPGGKIVVFTGLLRHFPSDAEIATVLGHEVAHVVARHSAERLTRHLFMTLVELFILAFFYAPDLVRSASALFLELPFSRSQELEADHIGLLLMAAAGYDPRVAPQMYEKLGKLTGTSDLSQYMTTHPSGNKRGERLRKTGTMDEAMNIYLEKTQGKTVEGFL